MGGLVDSTMTNTAKIAALFPGQGSQYAGMVRVLKNEFPWTVQLYEEASDSIGLDLLKLCLDGPDSELQFTFNAQPSILTTSYAWFEVLKRNLDFKPVVGAGHSLGEYTALLSAGALTLSDAVRLVRKRGELMQTAVPAGKGKMAALIGLSDEKVIELCQLASEGDTSLVVPANFNAPSQVVVAGHAGAVDRLTVIATDGKKPDLKARKVIPLNVSAPFHCPLMKPVAEAFSPLLKAAKWTPMTFSIVSNLDATLRSGGDMAALLTEQIDHSVLWTSSVKTIEKTGVEIYVEMGPGKVLTGLVKRIAEKSMLFNLDTMEDFKKFETAYKGNFKV